ncbi:hypothetical protein D9M70_442760 [compost metagenome]
MIEMVALDVGDEAGVGRHLGAEHRQPPGHGQHPLAECHRAHVEVALGEAQPVPLAHEVAAAHLAEFVGGQPAELGEQPEVGHGPADDARLEDAVAVDHHDHRIGRRQMPGNGAKAIGQAVALAGAGDTHEVQPDPCRGVVPRP